MLTRGVFIGDIHVDEVYQKLETACRVLTSFTAVLCEVSLMASDDVDIILGRLVHRLEVSDHVKRALRAKENLVFVASRVWEKPKTNWTREHVIEVLQFLIVLDELKRNTGDLSATASKSDHHVHRFANINC